METKSKTLALSGLALLMLGLTAGAWFGSHEKLTSNSRAVNSEAQKLIDAAYPKPAAELFGFSGIVKEVKNGELLFEIYHPDDYLPTNDRRKQIRTVSVTEATKIVELDFNKINKDGKFEQRQIKLTDLQPGQAVTITSDSNIKYAEKFEAKEIIRSK